MKTHNMHTHTTYSDGEFTPEQLIYRLSLYKYEIIGITDHGFSNKVTSVNNNNLQIYIDHLRKLQTREKTLEVKIGLEIDVSTHFGINPIALRIST